MVGVRIAQGKGGAKIDDAEVKMGQGLNGAGDGGDERMMRGEGKGCRWWTVQGRGW